jgi:hypothetical protein
VSELVHAPTCGRRLEIDILARAGRLLLEYNESTGAIHSALMSTARVLAPATCQVAVSYNGLTIAVPDARRHEMTQ